MALRYPEVQVLGAPNSGLIIMAAFPVHLVPAQNRDQCLTLTPAQSIDLYAKLKAVFEPPSELTPNEMIGPVGGGKVG